MGSQADAIHLGGIITAVNNLQFGEDPDDEYFDWEETTREERHWAQVARQLARILLEQTGYAVADRRDLDA